MVESGEGRCETPRPAIEKSEQHKSGPLCGLIALPFFNCKDTAKSEANGHRHRAKSMNRLLFHFTIDHSTFAFRIGLLLSISAVLDVAGKAGNTSA